MRQAQVLVVFECNFREPALDCDQFSLCSKVIRLNNPIEAVVDAHLRRIPVP